MSEAETFCFRLKGIEKKERFGFVTEKKRGCFSSRAMESAIPISSPRLDDFD